MALDDYGGWPGILERLCEGEHLSAGETEAILTEILSGEAEPAQIAGFLVGLKVKGETAEETTGLVKAMKELGITDKQIHTMLVENPQRVLAF